MMGNNDMNANFFVKCKTCYSIMRIRVQAGYYNWIPFTYECPECKVICSGEISIHSQISPSEKMNSKPIAKLKNCIEVNEDELAIDEVNSVIQLSSELYTDKFMKSEGVTHQMVNLSPHMQYAISGIDTSELQEIVLRFLCKLYSREEDYLAFWNLYEKSPKYLYKKKKLLNISNINLKNQNENQKIGFLQDFLYDEIRNNKYYKNLGYNFLSKVESIRKKKFKEFQKLSSFIEFNYLFFSRKLFTVTSNFLNYYNYILPIILNELAGTLKVDDVKTSLGIAQTDFETLKSFFSENYEDLKDLVVLLVLINNIYYREDISKFHEQFNSEFSKISGDIGNDLLLFNSKIRNVGNRIKIYKYDESNDIMDSVFDNEIRNSIDHRDYNYDYNNQLISFQNKSDGKKMYLIEFGNYLLKGFILANILWDVIMYVSKESRLSLDNK